MVKRPLLLHTVHVYETQLNIGLICCTLSKFSLCSRCSYTKSIVFFIFNEIYFMTKSEVLPRTIALSI